MIFGRELTDEDKIIFEHLSKRHEDLLSFADALDSKLAQIIALNGLILSFVFYRGKYKMAMLRHLVLDEV